MSHAGLTVDTLIDWTASGGHWRLVDASGGHVEVDLCACTGEAMERSRSDDPSVIEYVNRHWSDLTPEPW